MEKSQLRKNRLDLEYHGEAQKINVILILLTTGLLGFVSSFIWLSETKIFIFCLLLTFAVFFLGFLFYVNTSKQMKRILNEIENIE